MKVPEKPLTLNQKILMELSSQESNKDWGDSLGDTRKLNTRVMIKELIRTGNEKVLEIIAMYYGAQLVKRADVLQKQADLKQLTGKEFTYDHVEQMLFTRMNDRKRNKRQNSSVMVAKIGDDLVTIQIALAEEEKSVK